MINWNLANELIENAFDELVDEFGQEQIHQIEDSKWNWPRQTIRLEGKGVTGKVALTPRDIVDTAQLRDSLTIESISNTEVEYQYPVDYAAIVHNGATLNNGTGIPPRPWVESAIADYKPLEAFEDILKEKLRD